MAEVVIWTDTNYKVAYDDTTSELVYRIKIPLKEYAKPIAEKKVGELI